jgi:glycosyltransferase involved in cell wall biosynthesis
MKTVFMIAPYFVPRRRVGALRPYRFVTHLREFGWNPVVCTISDKNESMTPAEEKNLQGIKIIHISPPFDRTSRPAVEKNASQSKKPGKNISDYIADWFDRQVPMDTWYFLFRSSYAKILEDAKKSNPDVIWSTGDPWSGLWLGRKLASDLSKPWIADFRDPWTLSGLNLRKRSWFSSRADRLMEKKIITSAAKLVFTSRSTEKLYSDHYNLKATKAETIYNSYHPGQADNLNEWDGDFSDNHLNIVFFGSFRRLSPVLPVARSLSKMDADIRNKIRIHSFGSLEHSDVNLLESMGIRDQFLSHPKVKPEQAQSVFKKADLLLVSTSSERKTIIPAKLWEYLVSGKPILSITPNPEIGEILKETGAGVHFSNSQEREIAEWLTQFARQPRAVLSKNEYNTKSSAIEKFSSRQAAEKLAQIMNELVANEQ